MGRGPQLQRISQALEALSEEGASLDVKALEGGAPWRRLRIGDYRVLYRPITADDPSDAKYLVARIVHRRELERAVNTLE